MEDAVILSMKSFSMEITFQNALIPADFNSILIRLLVYAALNKVRQLNVKNFNIVTNLIPPISVKTYRIVLIPKVLFQILAIAFVEKILRKAIRHRLLCVQNLLEKFALRKRAHANQRFATIGWHL
jgi:hypothetical protein